ncbi:sulfite oxidase-like oxidoreductase [[Eubacterium] cellulosolvens]
MNKGSRRSYLKYLIGLFSGIGIVFVTAYFGLINGSKKPDTAQDRAGTSASRIPPGQYEVDQLQVLHVGEIPAFDPDTWTFEVLGLVENPFTLSWREFQSLPAIKSLSDFHCVTGWSKLDNMWGGIPFKNIYEMARPKKNAHYATIICDGGYTTSLPLAEYLTDDVILAYKLDDRQLEPRYGGPLRLVVPQKYAYKSAKWVRKIKFTEKQVLGYWEVRGYSNTADPWKEERYSGNLF